MNPIRLLVVDDHSLFRRGLVSLLMQDERFATPDQAADVGEALRYLSHAVPDLILLDNRLPGVRGVDAIGGLKEAAPGVKILMLTVSENENDLAAALQAGADGYLLKTVESDDLCNSILKVLSGESVISADMMTKLVCVFRQSRSDAQTPPSLPQSLAQNQEADPINTLSAREREVLKLIVHGASNKSIARQLDIAEATVKIHVQHILRKLQLSSRVQAAVYAEQCGF
jgi:two-component system nitrate/nitrite response regulator NarL